MISQKFSSSRPELQLQASRKLWPGVARARLAALMALACIAAWPALSRAADSSQAAEATPAKPAISKGEEKAMRDFKLLDFNRDGKLSRAEVALVPRLSAAFDEADTNHDGYVSYEEVQAFAVKYRAAREAAKAKEAAEHAAQAAPAPQQ